MTFAYILTGALMGLVFGIALEKGRVFEPGMIIGQFQLRNWTMLKMFMSAIATTMVVVSALTGLGLAELAPKADLYPAVIAGGLIFGVGMALTGACPGTVLAQIGAGYKDAWMTVAGGILGAMAYGYAEPFLSQMNSGPGKITVAGVLGVPYWTLSLPLAGLIVMFLFALERWRPWREDMGVNYDGVPSGSSRK
jgi:hypothetical protein